MTVGFKQMLRRAGGCGASWARLLKRAGLAVFGDNSRTVRSGNWYGNDTAWRMVLDLNRALFYFDGAGRPRERPLRYLTVVNGIVAGEGDGPMAADAIAAGLVVAGFNPVAADTVCATIMNFDYRKLPMLANVWQSTPHCLASFAPRQICCRSNVNDWNGSWDKFERAPCIAFRPHFGWRGEIERLRPAPPTHSAPIPPRRRNPALTPAANDLRSPSHFGRLSQQSDRGATSAGLGLWAVEKAGARRRLGAKLQGDAAGEPVLAVRPLPGPIPDGQLQNSFSTPMRTCLTTAASLTSAG